MLIKYNLVCLCVCMGANDVTYLEKWCKHVHPSAVWAVFSCWLHVHPWKPHLCVRAFPWCMQHLHTHLCIFHVYTQQILDERLKCRSAVSGSQVTHVKLRLFSNPLNGCEQSLWCPVFFCFLIQCRLINKCFSLFSLCRGDRRSEGQLSRTFYSFRFILDWRRVFSKARHHHHHQH